MWMSETCRGHLWEKIIVKLFASSWYTFLTYTAGICLKERHLVNLSQQSFNHKTNRIHFFNFFPIFRLSFSVTQFSLHPAAAFACELSGAVPREEITSSGFDPSITSPSFSVAARSVWITRPRHTNPPIPIPHPPTPKAISSLKTTFNSHPRFIWKPPCKQAL